MCLLQCDSTKCYMYMDTEVLVTNDWCYLYALWAIFVALLFQAPTEWLMYVRLVHTFVYFSSIIIMYGTIGKRTGARLRGLILILLYLWCNTFAQFLTTHTLYLPDTHFRTCIPFQFFFSFLLLILQSHRTRTICYYYSFYKKIGDRNLKKKWRWN